MHFLELDDLLIPDDGMTIVRRSGKYAGIPNYVAIISYDSGKRTEILLDLGSAGKLRDWLTAAIAEDK
jgi:hypothetical protein